MAELFPHFFADQRVFHGKSPRNQASIPAPWSGPRGVPRSCEKFFQEDSHKLFTNRRQAVPAPEKGLLPKTFLGTRAICAALIPAPTGRTVREILRGGVTRSADPAENGIPPGPPGGTHAYEAVPSPEDQHTGKKSRQVKEDEPAERNRDHRAAEGVGAGEPVSQRIWTRPQEGPAPGAKRLPRSQVRRDSSRDSSPEDSRTRQ